MEKTYQQYQKEQASTAGKYPVPQMGPLQPQYSIYVSDAGNIGQFEYKGHGH